MPVLYRDLTIRSDSCSESAQYEYEPYSGSAQHTHTHNTVVKVFRQAVNCKIYTRYVSSSVNF